MTRPLLNAGFGSPVGLTDLAVVASLGFLGVRQDIREVVSSAPITSELKAAHMLGLLVLDSKVWRSAGACESVAIIAKASGAEVWFEVGNECDGRGRGDEQPLDPRDYALAFADAEAAIRAIIPGAVVITAGITSTHRAGLAWLNSVVKTGLVSPDAVLGFHSYRSGAPERPHEGFASRSAEFGELRAIARGRRIANTEVGWTDARTSWWPCVHPLSEATVADYLRREIEINDNFEAECVVVFQLNDGAKSEEHFGIRRRDGSLKPSAHCLEPRA